MDFSALGFWDVATFVVAVSAVVWYAWFIRSDNEQRHEEDAARAFFDEHGHWPDEDPSMANRPPAPAPPPARADRP